MSWSPRDLNGMTQQRWESAKKQSVNAVLEANRNVQTWPQAYLCLLGATQHKEDKALLAGLVAQVIDPSEKDLTRTDRLIIWERITTGDILFEGKGFQVEDDVFTLAGRANWILRAITKKNFGFVKPKPSAESLRSLQDKWKRWLAGEDVEEYSTLYTAQDKGLEEIRSIAAVEALILSLQPSREKDQKTTECLRTIYHIDKLPTEPNAPGRLCSPDSWAYTYLAKATDVTGNHDPTWWLEWWQENKTALTWDSDTARFIIRKDTAKPN